jgi:hypothetical protein
MYHDLLVPHSSNSGHLLADLSGLNPDPSTDEILKSASGEAEEKRANESEMSGEVRGDANLELDEDLRALGQTVMMLIDTSGEDMEEDGVRGGSYRNTAEAEVVIAHVYRLYELGLRPDQIGIITPYNGQLEVLRELVAEREAAKGNAEEGMTAKGSY